MSKFEWNIQKKNVDDLLHQLLEIRGIDEDQQKMFLAPSWEDHQFSHTLFSGMEDAVGRFFDAVDRGQKIAIHGDYDADGVCGSSLLYLVMREIATELKSEIDLDVFLPDREKDGYGVAMHTVERMVQEGVQLLITVDCGIANIAEFARAKELGLDVIICDHHQLAPTVPEHAIILHPLAPGENYPNKYLCGTGVAFKFACGLLDEARRRGAQFREGYEKWFLDLVAIATVTDVMPLIGENRTLEKYGLLVLKRTKHKGLRALLNLVRTQDPDTETIGFRIGPRLNAAGRISSARAAFEAIVAEREEDAVIHAQQLETLNRRRQVISDQSYKEAVRMVMERVDNEADAKRHAHIVYADHWNPGVVGLIAGKLVTEFGAPAFAFAKVGDHYVGSGRSTGGLHLVEAMRSCGDIFIKYGGHPEACGLTLANVDRVQEFAQKIEIFAAGHFDGKILRPELRIDVEWPIDRIDWQTLAVVDQLQPFGQSNPKPIFVARNAEIKQVRRVGASGKHLKMIFENTQPHISCIGFNMGEMAEKALPGRRVDIAYQIGKSEWNGRDQIQVQLLDIDV